MEKRSFSPKQIVFCAAAVAISFVLSFIKLFPMPWGGSVTLCSMLFIVVVAYWYGPKIGLITGLVYGFLQFIQEPYVLTPFQVCCDYILAFAALGLAGFFWKQKNGLLIGYIVGALGRWFFHALGGYLYWMEYMPESFPVALKWAYPIIYNGSFIVGEGIITIILISLPPVKKALERIHQMAIS